MFNGIVNLYKPAGFTSHDAVAKLRGIFGQKKIGHTGTLDPDAEGVLPICLGKATKVCELLTDRSKTYQAVMLLGRATDTQDTSGETIFCSEKIAEEAEIREVIGLFQGEQMQIPPMYSALKVNGRKLYELAREGKTVERKARKIQIDEIRIDKIELPRVTMTISCSKGTYIRTLCNDIGEKLGCGACMEHLLRTRVGEFSLEDCLRIEDLQEAKEAERLEDCLIQVDSLFENYPGLSFLTEYSKYADNGNRLAQHMVKKMPKIDDKAMVRIYNEEGVFYGIYQYEEKSRDFKPVKRFKE
jgi:tRNA pseudouridine55 synthase